MKEKTVIGRVEKIIFPEMNNIIMRARIDTGAKTSSLSASAQVLSDGRLKVQLFDEPSVPALYFRHFSTVVVASSNGQVQTRYKVLITVVLKKRKIRAHFTLANRTSQVYPVLIGRNILRGKFVVDVSRGTPDKDLERARSNELQSSLEEIR